MNGLYNINTTMEAFPCRICGEGGHKVGTCPELWQNKVPPPERGQHGDDEDDHIALQERNTTISGNALAQDLSQTTGSKAGH